jgi:HEAT repeat protein
VAELEQMLGDADEKVQIQGAHGLSLRGADAARAVPALVHALESSHPVVRAQAALALGRIGPNARNAVMPLIAVLNDSEWLVRRQAALALGEIGPDSQLALPALRRLQKNDPNGLVRKAAKQALPQVQGGKGVGQN